VTSSSPKIRHQNFSFSSMPSIMPSPAKHAEHYAITSINWLEYNRKLY